MGGGGGGETTPGPRSPARGGVREWAGGLRPVTTFTAKRVKRHSSRHTPGEASVFLSAPLGSSRPLSAPLGPSRLLSAPLCSSRPLSAPLGPSRLLPAPLGPSRLLSAPLGRRRGSQWAKARRCHRAHRRRRSANAWPPSRHRSKTPTRARPAPAGLKRESVERETGRREEASFSAATSRRQGSEEAP